MVEVAKIIKVCTQLFKGSKVGLFAPYWEEVFEYAEISTPIRVAMFLGQVGVESDGFTVFEENLNYRPDRLVEVWPKRFRLPKTTEDKNIDQFQDGKKNALLYARNPEKLAIATYGGRNGNRSFPHRDGWIFRGRGPKQITGASNYLEFTNDLGEALERDFIKEPDALLKPRIGLYGAGWFWKENNINKYADTKNVSKVTKIVNGGQMKLTERTQIFNEALKLLS